MQTHREQYVINTNSSKNKNILTKITQLSPLENNKNDKDALEEIKKAIISNDLDKLINLLNKKNNANTYNYSWEIPLFLCIDFDKSKALNILLKNGVNCNIQNKDGNTPLHMAVIKKKEKCINILLDNKANPNIINEVKLQTPFHLAIINKVNKNILRKFKKNNVDWNVKDKFNKTPLDYALDFTDNNYLLLLDDIFGQKDNNNDISDNSKRTFFEVNSKNYKSLSKYNNSYKLTDKFQCNNDENKENNNFYNKGETNANTMSEIYSPRENNSKKNMVSFPKENIIEEKENINNNILKDFSLSESNFIFSNNSFRINEKDFKRKKYQSLVNRESNDFMKKIIMDTVKKINRCQTNKASEKKNLSFDIKINNFKNINKVQSSSLNEINPSETNHLVSRISTVLDETVNSNTIINNRNNSTFIKTEMEDNLQLLNKEFKNENKDGEIIIIKDSMNNSSNNETFNDNISKNSFNLNKLKNNSNNKKDIKYMIIQQIKEKNKKIELGSPSTIPNEILNNLKYWLISCDLINYYNLLIEKHFYNIDEIISGIKNKKINIDYKFVEELGIKKPGHIFRFLLKLQIDADILDKQICYSIIEKYNNNTNTILLNSSTNDIKCCGVSCFSHSPSPSVVSESVNIMNNNDIFSFLKSKDLFEFRENFVHNGFDQVDYVIIQLFSNFKFDKNMMVEYFHIYLENSQKKIIKKLYEEKEKISKEFNIIFNRNELNEILSSFKDDLAVQQNNESCIIF